MVRPVVINGGQLRTLDDLYRSGFGRPLPRHGLMLLFWFANECVNFDDHNNTWVRCQPEKGDFGFHHFGNFEEILPVLVRDGREKYFEVGNLNTENYPEANDLQPYVRRYYELAPGNYRQSNKDRIIIKLNQRKVKATYVTEHKDGNRGDFDPEHTHLVSPDLIRDIQELELKEFLELTGYMGPTLRNRLLRALKAISDIPSQPSGHSGSERDTWDLELGQSGSQMEELQRNKCTRSCKICGFLVALLVVLLVIIFTVLSYLGKL
ncbi:uncharacterized protein LOC105029331 [Esox lucius]|uniref:Uncharacterized protein n=1 Tax=Esox lucius TaxID=8010 RepID=A0A6Q2XXV6_ESOLU|nr:uncharacterized protein LOC105029331 [Esox lucius]